MTNSTISPPAHFVDSHPQRGPWRAIEIPPPPYDIVQVLRPDGTTAYQATCIGVEWWYANVFVRPLGWRSINAVVHQDSLLASGGPAEWPEIARRGAEMLDKLRATRETGR